MSNSAHSVAIVDDEAPIRHALERLLRSAGLDARGFATGADFLAGLAARRPDCLIADLHMPGMSGLELVRQLQAMRLRLPVVVITAYDDPDSRARCLEAGAVAYLRKPLDQRVLLDAIALAIGPRSNSAR
jgi:two-component system, LuxR family, response regulator FixJ